MKEAADDLAGFAVNNNIVLIDNYRLSPAPQPRPGLVHLAVVGISLVTGVLMLGVFAGRPYRQLHTGKN